MSEHTSLSGLTIPEQKAPDKSSFDVRPKFMNKWIASLPMANLGETSRLVFKVIVEINRLQIPVQKRFSALESLREPCRYIADSLEKHFTGRPLPLNDRNRKISELARALMSELAVSYKIIVRQLLEESSRPDSKLLVTSLHRIISYQGMLLLRSYQIYAPYPRDVWRELYTIYQYTEQHELLDTNIKDKLNLLPGSSTIALVFKKILLLSLTIPYRLHRGEVDKVCTILNQLASYSTIEKIPLGHDPQGLFIVDLFTDKPPGYLAMHQGSDFRSCRLFNTNEMVAHLYEKRIDADKELLELVSDNLLQRLLTSWSVMSKRSFSRIPKDSAFVEVAFGLSASHNFVSGEQAFVTEDVAPDVSVLNSKPQSQYHSTKISNLSDSHVGPDIWNLNYTYSTNDPINAKPVTAVLNNEERTSSHEYETLRLRMTNVSAGGYCLISQENPGFSVHVGDLLSIREYEDKSIEQWGIGVVRRMKSSRNGKIELGVQMLTPNAVAVGARLEAGNGSSRGSEYLRCMMVPELRAINQPATIITPALPFKTGSKIRINLHDKQILATLTQQLEHTRGFSQFEFSVKAETHKQDIPKKQPAAEPVVEHDFDSIWSSL